MKIAIRPFDTLFVRDGKPFSIGEEVWAGGIFPPPPSVFYGALRTAYFSDHLDELERAGSSDDMTNKLRIGNISLLKDENQYLVCPYDVVEEKNSADNEQIIEILKLTASNFLSSSAIGFVLKAKTANPVQSIGGNHYLTKATFENYLKGKENIQGLPLKYFQAPEPKIGIKKDRLSGGSEEGMLYRVDMVRLADGVSFLLDFDFNIEGYHFPEKGLLKIGGEGKLSSYLKWDNNNTIAKPEFPEGETRFKLVFATPTVFENGWLPKGFNEETLEGIWNGVKLKVLTAAVDRAQYLGGFKMRTKNVKGGPKPMRRVVPAGAVYYLEIIDGSPISAVTDIFHNKCSAEFDMDKEGYGLAFTGLIKR